ncbi:MAG: sugar phosphate isomerase/epimerase [Chloroflexi bacterium]|nr:sugar phosphate isomerase/epimerase [Chloroflexota bacterium]
MSKLPVALQLYTLREQLAADFTGVIKRVGQMGYMGVELAGYGGLSAEALKELLDEAGLRIAGDHVGLDRLENQLDGVIAFSKAIGNDTVVLPAVPAQRRGDLAGWRSLADELTHIGERFVDQGLTFCYHNHAWEFAPLDGTDGFHVLFGESDPRYVKIELDTFWAKKGGFDPVALMREFSGRVPLLHLKDMTADEEATFAEVGEGTMDFQAIFQAATVAGARWYIVEQDRCRRSPLESVAISLRHLREWGIA